MFQNELYTTFSEFFIKTWKFLPDLFLGSLIILFFWIFGNIVKKVFLFINAKYTPGQVDIFYLLGKFLKGILVLIGMILAMGKMGIDANAIVASLGLTGFALGFALRDILSNILSGVLILLYKPFYRGDQIFVAGLEGKVLQFDLRYTTLASGEKTILIPNSTLFTNAITVLRKAGNSQSPD